MKTFVVRDKSTMKRCLDFIATLPAKAWKVEIVEYRKKRSLDANRFYWGQVIAPLAEHTGYTPEEIHEILLMDIYGSNVKTFNGVEYAMPNQRTHKMNVQQFQDHIYRAQVIAANLGVQTGPTGIYDMEAA